jgi:hypothetical protein
MNISLSPINPQDKEGSMSLADDLAELRERSKERISADQYEAMINATENLEESGITESGLKEGDIAPEFVLPNAVGTNISLWDLLKKGPVVLSFYRGGW